jgi:hypothetical protein
MSWKIALALCLVGTLLGCQNDPCTNADDLVAACAPSDQATPSGSSTSETLACGGARLCHAACINQASCLEINALQCVSAVACPPLVGDGGPAPYVSPLAQCILACSAASDAGTD